MTTKTEHKPFDAPEGTGAIHLLSDARGVYIPQNFIEFENEEQRTGGELSAEDKAVIESGPEHADYWDVWTTILDTFEYTDSNGYVWSLYQEGDVWLICPALMSCEEVKNFELEDMGCIDIECQHCYSEGVA